MKIALKINRYIARQKKCEFICLTNFPYFYIGFFTYKQRLVPTCNGKENNNNKTDVLSNIFNQTAMSEQVNIESHHESNV